MPSLSDIRSCLLFHISGAMCSWGSSTSGAYRPTDGYPTKSAIVGILAASLGIDRFDNKRQAQLYADFDYVVISAGTEEYIADFATIQTTMMPKGETITSLPPRAEELSRGELKTIVADRRYLCNGYYTIIVIPIGKSAIPLSELKRALEHPHYVPYLGRKSCPLSAPLCPTIEEYESIVQVIKEHKFEPFLKDKDVSIFLSKHCSPHIYATFKMGGDSFIKRTRADNNPDRDNWQFSERDEFEYLGDWI